MIADPVEVLLQELHDRGVELRASGDVLRFRPVEAVPPELIDRMRRHKAALLERSPLYDDGSSATDWAASARRLIGEFMDDNLRTDLTDHFEETAAKLEYEANYARPMAEMLSFGELIAEILRRGLDARAVRPASAAPTGSPPAGPSLPPAGNDASRAQGGADHER